MLRHIPVLPKKSTIFSHKTDNLALMELLDMEDIRSFSSAKKKKKDQLKH